MSTLSGLFEEPLASQATSTRSRSPGRMLISLVALIFLAEMVSMTVLYFIPTSSYLVEALLDGLIMVALILPVLFTLQLNPLLKEINERTRAEQALRTSEELLRKVLELLPVGVWITDRNGKIVHGNPASRKIWGGARYVDRDHYGDYKAWWADSCKPVEPEEWAVARAIHQRVTVLDEEVEIEAFDGTRKIILNSAIPILDEQAAVQGAIIVNQEISERRQAERTLLRTNELLERFFFNIDTLIAYMDREFNFIRVNDTYAKSGGHPVEFFPGKNHFDLFPNPENQAIFEQVVETGEPFSVLEKPFEYAEHPEWGVTYWDWSLQPVKGADGKVDGLVMSLVDVTERKRAELQLERQNLELRQLSEAEHRQRELAESLVRATITVNTSLELDKVLGSILEQIRKNIPFQGANIILIEGQTLHVAAFLGYEDYPGSRFLMEGSHDVDQFPLIQQVCSTFQPLLIESVKEAPGWRKALEMEWVLSAIVVPLIYSGQVIGVINLNSERRRAFTQEAVDRLQAFAAPAALALHNARLFNAESKARRAAETLSAAAQELTQTLDLDQVANILLDRIQGVVQADITAVTLLRDESGLSVIAARGYTSWAGRENFPELPLDNLTEEVLQRMKQERRSLIVPNVQDYPIGEDRGLLNHIENWLFVPITARDKNIGIVGLGKVRPGIFIQEEIEWAEALVGQAGVAIQNAWLFEQVRSSSDRLQSLARKLVEVQENERYHIARELHDQAGQSLSSLKLSLGRLEQDPECPPAMRQQLSDSKNLVDCVLEDLHRLAMDLRPAALDHLGLVAALEQFASNLTAEGLSVQLKAIGFDEERLPQDLETSLYRIVQEALTNVVRHAQASRVGILLKRDGSRLVLFVEDNGVGFAPDQAEKGERLGLVGMQERAEMLGGTLTIESSSEQGTTITVEVPDVHSYSHRG